MIVVLKHGVSDEKKAQLIAWLQALGLKIHVSNGEFQTVLGLIGDTSGVDVDLVESLEDNRLLALQTHEHQEGNHEENERNSAQPQQSAPVTPEDGIVLNILRSIELVRMQGINLYGKNLQCQRL